MPRALALTCNSCGAYLDVPEGVEFVTCQHCNVRLRIERTEGTVFTRVMERVARVEEQVSTTAAAVHVIELERKLEKIEAELAGLSNPGGWGIVILCGSIAAFGGLLALTSNPEAQGAGIVNLFFFGLLALWFGTGLPKRQRKYAAERDRLEAARAACMDELAAARQADTKDATLQPVTGDDPPADS